MSERVGAAVLLLLVLVLPLSALLARRLPGRTVLRYALVWVGIFVTLLIIVIYFT